MLSASWVATISFIFSNFVFDLLCKNLHENNKTKVLSVQLGKTLSFVKFVVEWSRGLGEGGSKPLDCSSLTLKRPAYQILASCYA